MQQRFFELAARACSGLRGREVLLCHFVGEESAFVRFNRARVRQAMTVRQGHVALTLIDGARRDTTTLAISGNAHEDDARVSAALGDMRAGLPSLPEDPYLLYSQEPTISERIERGELPDAHSACEQILDAAQGTDLVGFSALGPVLRGFASSLGHRHWHHVDSFSFDWSLYHAADKAVHASYSTTQFSGPALLERVQSARSTLEHLARPAKTVEPGRYRVFLTPAAMAELVSMLNWGGVSEKAQRTKTSCLQKLADGEARLSDKVSFRENTAAGLAPVFDEVGFRKPPSVELIRGGRHAGALASPRTASEYGIAANADADESLRSAELDPGALATADALRELGTGLYVSNLWYLNFSDRASARITGMTRFATFWVERGQIVAPLNVMRFDDSLYRLLGDQLVELTREREWQLSTSTYGQRSVETTRLPGALIHDVAFTL